MTALRPLVHCSILLIYTAEPQLLSETYHQIYKSVRGNPLKEWMLRTALAAKQRAFCEERASSTIWDKLIFDKVKNNFGTKIRVIVAGSASLEPRVAEVIRNVFGCVVGDRTTRLN